MSTLEGISKRFSNDRYLPPLFGALLFGLALLTYKDFEADIRKVLFPALAVYPLGSFVIAYLQAMLSYDAEKKQQRSSSTVEGLFGGWLYFCMFLQVTWFVALLYYLHHKNIL